jgi:hypothetical protein
MAAPHMPDAKFPPFNAARLTADVDPYLAAAEGGFTDIRPGAAKRVAGPTRRFAIARRWRWFTCMDLRLQPKKSGNLPDKVAAAFGANLYFAGLCGHGANIRAMSEASVSAWLDDLAESLAVGEALGERVVMIGMSTGASLVTAALGDASFRSRIAARVFLSPSYGISRPDASLLTLPSSSLLARLLLSRTYSFLQANAEHAAHWTTSYPSSALYPWRLC